MLSDSRLRIEKSKIGFQEDMQPNYIYVHYRKLMISVDKLLFKTRTGRSDKSLTSMRTIDNNLWSMKILVRDGAIQELGVNREIDRIR